MAANPLVPNAIGNNRYAMASNTETGITATSGGGQANAYALTAQVSEILTVAAPADSVALPKITPQSQSAAAPGQVGMMMFVYNESANACQVFGATPDTINTVATGTGVSIPAGKSAVFVAYKYTTSTNVGEWMMILSA